MGPLFEPHLPALADKFYATILRNEPTRRIIEEGGHDPDQLLQALIQWARGLSGGRYDEGYARERLRIGERYVHIGLAPRYVFSAFNIVRSFLQDVVSAAYVDQQQEREDKLRALHRILDIDLSLISESYAAESRAVTARSELDVRTRTETALHESEARSQAVLDTAVDAIITIDEQGRIESFNKAAEQIFGYTADEVAGENVSVLMPSPYREEHDSYVGNYLRTGEKKIIGIGREIIGRRKDGTSFPMELAVSEVQLGTRRIFTGIVRDISERKRSEEALKKERDLIAAILDTTDCLVVVLDAAGRIVRFNRACERTTGYELKEVLDRHVWDMFLIPEEIDGVRAVFDELRAGHFPNENENYWVTRDGNRRLIAWSNTALKNDQGAVEYVIGIGIDITEQRQIQTQIAHQEKMAAVGQLAAGVAHEIGNPLSSISAITQTLSRKLHDTYLVEKLDLVSKHIDRISAIVHQMVNFARPARSVWRPCDIKSVIKNTVDILRYDKRAKRVAIEVEHAQDLPITYAMEDHLSQVFLNIALNALDALENVPTERKPCLTISTRAATNDLGAVITIVFEDNGPGVSREAIQRVFEPFFTTKEVGKGTGLGLAVSYRIVQDHGGRVRVESKPGAGARFIVEIPVRDQSPEKKE